MHWIVLTWTMNNWMGFDLLHATGLAPSRTPAWGAARVPEVALADAAAFVTVDTTKSVTVVVTVAMFDVRATAQYKSS